MWICRALLRESDHLYRVLLQICRALLQMYTTLLRESNYLHPRSPALPYAFSFSCPQRPFYCPLQATVCVCERERERARELERERAHSYFRIHRALFTAHCRKQYARIHICVESTFVQNPHLSRIHICSITHLLCTYTHKCS